MQILQLVIHKYKTEIFGQFFKNSFPIGEKIRFDSVEDADNYAAAYFEYPITKIRNWWLGNKTLYVTKKL